MADKSHSGLSRQCRLLSINRSWVYYKPRLISTDDLEMMKRIDTEYMKCPTSGSRTIRDVLARQGHKANRKRIQRLMRLMGIGTIYPKPKTSKPHPLSVNIIVALFEKCFSNSKASWSIAL
ncbi:hypothetical protein CSA57_14535 [candidate division KSB3 bacterium]|nr:MAG: hypothetical protein CSA57_14535 [candidate division KSB3 bacterium]